MPDNGQHFVAVIGGAISGSVSAEILADHGIRVAVFEQNNRPYGKDRGRPASLARRAAQAGIRPHRRAPEKARRVLHSLRPSSAATLALPNSAILGLFRRDPSQWRVARPRPRRARRREICRQRPRLPEPVHLLVQPQERKELFGSSIRNAGRSSRGRRRACLASTS